MVAMARYGTRNLERATKFYDELFDILGAKRFQEIPNGVTWKGEQGAIFAVGLPFEGEATAGNGTQIAFAASSAAVVDAVHAKALELGGHDEGAPGLRGPESYGFYATYFRDLDGNKLLVFHIAAG